MLKKSWSFDQVFSVNCGVAVIRFVPRPLFIEAYWCGVSLPGWGVVYDGVITAPLTWRMASITTSTPNTMIG